MKVIALLASFLAVQATKIQSGVLVNGVNHEKEILYENLGRPRNLAVDYETNQLYFCYSNSGDDFAQSAILDINSKKYKNIEGNILIPQSKDLAHAVDQKSHTLYIGGLNGLYKYDNNTNEANIMISTQSGVWTVFFKDILYYSEDQALNTFKDQVSNSFVELEDTTVDNFVVDSDDNIFFTNNTGLFFFMKKTNTTVFITGTFSETSLSTDKYGKVYASLHDGIYKIIKENATIEKVVQIEGNVGVAFDKDNNIIYSDETKLIRLKPMEDTTDMNVLFNNIKDQQLRIENKLDKLASLVEPLSKNYDSIKTLIERVETELISDHQYNTTFKNVVDYIQNYTFVADVTY